MYYCIPHIDLHPSLEPVLLALARGSNFSVVSVSGGLLPDRLVSLDDGVSDSLYTVNTSAMTWIMIRYIRYSAK